METCQWQDAQAKFGSLSVCKRLQTSALVVELQKTNPAFRPGLQFKKYNLL